MATAIGTTRWVVWRRSRQLSRCSHRGQERRTRARISATSTMTDVTALSGENPFLLELPVGHRLNDLLRSTTCGLGGFGNVGLAGRGRIDQQRPAGRRRSGARWRRVLTIALYDVIALWAALKQFVGLGDWYQLPKISLPSACIVTSNFSPNARRTRLGPGGVVGAGFFVSRSQQARGWRVIGDRRGPQ